MIIRNTNSGANSDFMNVDELRDAKLSEYADEALVQKHQY